MKKFIISDCPPVGIDTETEDVFALKSEREAISRIHIATEPIHIIVNKFGKQYNLEAKEGDLIITFYESDFPYPAVVVSNEKWTENINAYNNLQKPLDCESESKPENNYE